MTTLDELNNCIAQAFDALLTNLAKGQSDSRAIENQFHGLFQQITDVEEISYPHFVKHRHLYHMIRVKYYQKIKDQDKIEKEERLAVKYASLSTQYCTTETPVSTNSALDDETFDTSEWSWETVCNLVTSLSQLQDSDQIINNLRSIRHQLQSLFQPQIRTLDEYCLFLNNCQQIQSLLETLKVNEFDLVLDENDSMNSTNYCDQLTEIIDYVSKGLLANQNQFANTLLSDLPRLDEIIFGDVPQTELCIKQRYREWARLFHSDKHQSNPMFDELMKNIHSIRDRYLSKFHALRVSSDIVKVELEAGHRDAEASIVFKNRFKSGGDAELTVEKLRKLIAFEALIHRFSTLSSGSEISRSNKSRRKYHDAHSNSRMDGYDDASIGKS